MNVVLSDGLTNTSFELALPLKITIAGYIIKSLPGNPPLLVLNLLSSKFKFFLYQQAIVVSIQILSINIHVPERAFDRYSALKYQS